MVMLVRKDWSPSMFLLGDSYPESLAINSIGMSNNKHRKDSLSLNYLLLLGVAVSEPKYPRPPTSNRYPLRNIARDNLASEGPILSFESVAMGSPLYPCDLRSHTGKLSPLSMVSIK